MYHVARKLEFDYGHRLLRHPGKCSNYHGHRGVVIPFLSSPKLDTIGVVIDFAQIKETFTHIVDVFDHAMVVEEGDPIIPFLLLHKQKHYVMDCAPSAENLAALLLRLMRIALTTVDANLTLSYIELYETPNCWVRVD